MDVDVGLLVRRLLLFDTYILDSVRLLETRALIDAFGLDGLVTLLKSGALKIRCDGFTAGQIGQFPAATKQLPLNSYRLATIIPGSRKDYISHCLHNVERAGLAKKDYKRLKLVYLDSLVPATDAAAGIGPLRDVPRDLGNEQVARMAIAKAAKDLAGFDGSMDKLALKVHRVEEDAFSLESNLRYVCHVDEIAEHRILERAALGVAGLNLRLAEMRIFNALSEVLDDERSLVGSKLDIIGRELAPSNDDRQFCRLIELGELPDVAAGTRIDVQALLKARQSRECVEFRIWLHSADSFSDSEIYERLRSLRIQMNGFMAGVPGGEPLRFIATTALGAVPGVAASAAPQGGALDAFIADNLFVHSGPAIFLSKYYASLFGPPIASGPITTRTPPAPGPSASLAPVVESASTALAPPHDSLSVEGGLDMGPSVKSPADVVILCALRDPELDKVKRAGGVPWTELPPTREDPQTYYTATYTTARGAPLRVVAAAPNHMGMPASAVLATKMIIRFRPRLVVMAGIAAGVKKEGRGFGDVIAAEHTFDYGSGKVTVTGEKGHEKVVFHPDPKPLDVDARLLQRLRHWQTDRVDVLDAIRRAWNAQAPDTVLRMHVGPLASGAAVVDHGPSVDQIVEHWRKLVGLEMEAYAVHRACKDTLEQQPKFVCLKAICDFAHDKEDHWRNYAAYTAGELSHRFLVAEWENLFPTGFAG